jgi:hypothetical protein
MKPQTASSVVVSVRCAHRSPGGRRCRLSVSDPRSVFCPQHRSEQLEEEAADHFPCLSRNFQSFQTAQGINHALMNLFQLLAQNRISPRRAAVLTHICGLLLRSLPQIDADRAAGILDPTKPQTIDTPVSFPAEAVATKEGNESEEVGENAAENETDAEAQNANIDPGPDSHTESHAELDADADLDTDADTDEEPGSDPGYKGYWDTSIPKPDPRKKPS